MLSRQNRKMLQDLWLSQQQELHPTIPDHCRGTKTFSDKNANELEKTIVWFLNTVGHQAERIKTQGRYLKPEQVVDYVGFARTIGRGKYIPPTGDTGSADISATIHGRSVKIEVKIGRDRQSDAQSTYQARIERSGGVYMIAKTFDQWIEEYNQLTNQKNQTA